jgi:hypothetical protein
LLVFGPTRADAQHHHGGGGFHGSVVFVGGYYYDPWWGPYPWWPPAAYPYGYYPIYDASAQLRFLVTPREASVYVDGFYAGIVDDFDGVFQRLPVPPGGHEVVLYLTGYRTVHQTFYAQAASTFKIQYKMEKLPAGETSEPPPVAPPVPPPPEGSAVLPPPRPGAPRPPYYPPPSVPPPDQSARVSNFGTLAIRVQPSDAQITIDGDRWTTSDERGGLTVQVSEGRHHVEIQKTGYRSFSTDIAVRGGETTPLNVSLSPE